MTKGHGDRCEIVFPRNAEAATESFIVATQW